MVNLSYNSNDTGLFELTTMYQNDHSISDSKIFEGESTNLNNYSSKSLFFTFLSLACLQLGGDFSGIEHSITHDIMPSKASSFINTSTTFFTTTDKDLQRFMNNSANLSLTRSELFQQLDFLHDLTIKQKLSKYDEILSKINISSVNTTLIIGLLRTAFFHKDNIPNWDKFLVEAKNELISRNLDANKLLIGLL